MIAEIIFWGGGTDISSTWKDGSGNADVEKDRTRHHSEEIPVASKGDSVTRTIKSPTKVFPKYYHTKGKVRLREYSYDYLGPPQTIRRDRNREV